MSKKIQCKELHVNDNKYFELPITSEVLVSEFVKVLERYDEIYHILQNNNNSKSIYISDIGLYHLMMEFNTIIDFK